MSRWIKKNGYETFNLATENDLDGKETQLQLVRFHTGKHGHYHKRKTEFFYFTKGEGKVIINNEEKKLTQGGWLLVKPNVYHTFINESENPLEAIMFKTNHQSEDTFIK